MVIRMGPMAMSNRKWTMNPGMRPKKTTFSIPQKPSNNGESSQRSRNKNDGAKNVPKPLPANKKSTKRRSGDSTSPSKRSCSFAHSWPPPISRQPTRLQSFLSTAKPLPISWSRELGILIPLFPGTKRRFKLTVVYNMPSQHHHHGRLLLLQI